MFMRVPEGFGVSEWDCKPSVLESLESVHKKGTTMIFVPSSLARKTSTAVDLHTSLRLVPRLCGIRIGWLSPACPWDRGHPSGRVLLLAWLASVCRSLATKRSD